MRKLFYPAIFVMNRLTFSKKIVLLGLIYFIAFSMLIVSLYKHFNTQVSIAQQELQVITLITPVLKLIQSTQRYRGLSAGVLGGELNFKSELLTESEQQEKAFTFLKAQLPEIVMTSPLWNTIVQEKQAIDKSGLTWTKEENFNRHVQFIQHLQQLIVYVSDVYRLTLDSDMASHYLITTATQDMPAVLEQLGQIRAYGTGILARQHLSESQQIKIYILLKTLNHALNTSVSNLEKTRQYNPSMQVTLTLAQHEIKQFSEKISTLVHSDILTQQFHTLPSAFFNVSTDAINTGYTQIYQALLPALNTLLQSRIQQAKKDLIIYVGGALFFALFAQYLFLGLYYAVITHIQLLAKAADRFAQGDMQQRISLQTNDEIKQIGNSFNKMAESFNQLLSAHLVDNHRLQFIIEAALDAIIQIDQTGNIITWNSQAEIIFGWTKDEAIGQKIHELIIPTKYRQQHLQSFNKFLHKKETEDLKRRFEIEGLHKKGQEIPIELSISSVNTARGVELTAFIRDLTEQKKAEGMVNQLSLAVEQSPSSIVITNIDAEIEYVNRAFLMTTGYEEAEVLGKNPRIFSAKKTPASTYKMLWETLTQGHIWKGELINRRKNGNEYIELAIISPVRQKNGKITHYLAIKEDISEKKQAEIELGIAAIAFESNEAILVTDAKQKILRVNKAFTKMTGYLPEEVIGKTPEILQSSRQADTFYQMTLNTLNKQEVWQGDVWLQNKQGHDYPAWLTITARKNNQHEITHYVAMFTDITAFKAAEEEIKQLAYFDPLTQLANRRKLLEQLENSIARCTREQSELAILMLDLDRFKAVNDNFGHLAGDELLQQVAQRIQQRLRKTDLLARLGGDEFVILLEDIKASNNAARIAEEIIKCLKKPFQLSKAEGVCIGVSIGISLYPKHAKSSTLLMDYADMALYQAKDKGRGCFSYFSEELTRVTRQRLQLETDLRQAIIQNQLCLYYQPQICLATGKIIGAEALVRWQVNEKIISPADFIPIAEESGLILELGEWVLLEVCRQGQQWLKEGLKPITLAVNTSAQQFKANVLHDLVVKILRKTEYPASQLELEITETGLMVQADHVVESLYKLRELGIQLAIDDFGTGYSSLAYLKRFPIDTLKIDKSFIENIPSDQSDREITTAINNMGHTLGFKVLAEGVETPEQLEFLKAMGCDFYQGYIKSKPLPANEFAKFLDV